MSSKKGLQAHTGAGKGWGRTAMLATWLSLTATWTLMHVFHGSQQLFRASMQKEKVLVTEEKREKEEDSFRSLLRETREGVVNFENTPAVDRFWHSMQQTDLTMGHVIDRKDEDGHTDVIGGEKIGDFKTDSENIDSTGIIGPETTISTNPEESMASMDRMVTGQGNLLAGNEVSEQTQDDSESAILGNILKGEGLERNYESKLGRDRLSEVKLLGREEAKDESTDRSGKPSSAARRWCAPKECANAEEMGRAVVGDNVRASLQTRQRVALHFGEHGASRLRKLPADEFCGRGFVMCKGQHDGFGNNLYKILTGAALAMLLNRSMIIGESGKKNFSSTDPEYVSQKKELAFPFGDYLEYSPEMMSMQEVKQLWVKHGCAARHGRPFTMRVDYFSRLASSKVLCEDWTLWEQPVLWFADATDAVGIQWFLKNDCASMRERARGLMGSESEPDTRPNLFGELARALLRPKPVINMAIEWLLQEQGDPDFVVHIRHGKVQSTIEAATRCFMDSLLQHPRWNKERLPRVAVISDTPETAKKMTALLASKAQVAKFEYEAFVKAHPNISVMSSTYFTAPTTRVEDWGPLPRWVALVEFFLASRAQLGLVSGAGSRVATTFAQLAAAMAAANRLDNNGDDKGFTFFSSFQAHLLELGLQRQSGRGYTWHTFSGPLSCFPQKRQCAVTPLFPYAWWDAPWQSPSGQQLRKLRSMGLLVSSDGEVTPFVVKEFCRVNRKGHPVVIELALPECKDVGICVQ